MRRGRDKVGEKEGQKEHACVVGLVSANVGRGFREFYIFRCRPTSYHIYIYIYIYRYLPDPYVGQMSAQVSHPGLPFKHFIRRTSNHESPERRFRGPPPKVHTDYLHTYKRYIYHITPRSQLGSWRKHKKHEMAADGCAEEVSADMTCCYHSSTNRLTLPRKHISSA